MSCIAAYARGMRKRAKIFQNGRSKTVRLPAECRFDVPEAHIRRDAATGDVTPSRRPSNWSEIFRLLDDAAIPADLLADRRQGLPQERPEA